MRLRTAVLSSLLVAAGCASAQAEMRGGEAYADYLVARYAERRNDPAGAATHYESALRAAPDDPLLIQGAADSALANLDIPRAQAIGALAQRRRVEPPVSSRLATATAALVDGRARRTKEVLTRLDGAFADELAARVLRVWADAALGDRDAALDALDADTAAPKSVWGALRAYQRAMLFELDGKTEEAAAAFTAATAGSSTMQVAQLVLQHGEFLERAGRREDAAALYDQALPTLQNPALSAAASRVKEGGAPPPAPNPRRAAAIAMYALALMASYPPEQQQLQLLSLSLSLDPTLEGPKLAYAESMRALGQGARARELLAQVPAVSPFYATAQTQIGWSHFADKDDAAAVKTLSALCDATATESACRNLADLYRALERYEAAAPIYERYARAAKEDSDDWRLFYQYGATLERLDRWQEAEAALQRSLKISPLRPETLNYLGYSWVERGEKVEEGLALLQKAVVQRPNAGYIVDSLGWAHYKLGRFGQAGEFLEHAVELSPSDPTLNDHLGDVYWRLGRRNEARFQWRRVLTLNPPPALRAAVDEKLRSGLPPINSAPTPNASTAP